MKKILLGLISVTVILVLSGCTDTQPDNCDNIRCVWDPCPDQHIPDENGCVTCASPCRENKCSSDSDCVPAQCCHSTACVPKDQAPNCDGVACTEECRGGTIDCGQGSCACVDNKCQVELDATVKKYCERDSDCTVQSTDDCCGRESVNKYYSENIDQICLRVCPEYKAKCKNNACVLVE